MKPSRPESVEVGDLALNRLGFVVAVVVALASGCRDGAPSPPGLAASRQTLQGAVVGPEKSYPSTALGPRKRDTSSPAGSFDGTQFLLVWVEHESLLARRTHADGTPFGDLITLDSPDGYVWDLAAVAWTGSHFLVAWAERDPAGSTLKIAQILPDGSQLPSSPVTLGPAVSWWEGTVAITRTSNGALVTWTNSDFLRVALRLGPDGTPHPGEAPLLLDAAPSGNYSPSLSWDGIDSVLAVWGRARERDVWASVVPDELGSVPTAATQLASGQFPRATWAGTHHVAMWRQSAAEPTGVLMNRTGTVIGVANPPSPSFSSGSYPNEFSLVGAPSGEVLATWSTDPLNVLPTPPQRVVRRFDAFGLPIGDAISVSPAPGQVAPWDPVALIPGPANTTLLLWGVGEFKFNWQRPMATSVLGSNGIPTSPVMKVLAPVPMSQTPVALAASANGYLGLSTDWLAPRLHDLKATLVDLNGDTLVAPLLLDTGSVLEQSAAAAWTGTHWAAAWMRQDPMGSTRIEGRFISAAGQPLASWTLPTPPAENSVEQPRLVISDGRLFVVWSVWSAGKASAKTLIAEMDATTGHSKPTVIEVADCVAAAISVATEGFTLLCDDNTSAAIRWLEVYVDGRLPLERPTLGVIADSRQQHQLAFDGAGFLFAYTAGWGSRVEVLRLNEAGAVLSQVWVPSPGGSAESPSLAWDGEQYVLSFTYWGAADRRTGVARISSSGTLLESFELVPSASTGHIAFTGPGRGLLHYGAGRAAHEDAAMRTISIDRPPRGTQQSLSTAEDSPLSLVLSGTDPDGDVISGFRIISEPINGVLSGTPPNLVYQPNADFHGQDEFWFEAEAAQCPSMPTKVEITVTSVDDPPVAQPRSLSTAEDEAVQLVLAASDLENDTLTFQIVTPPRSGVLSGEPPNLTYTPAPDFHGNDALTFSVSDATSTVTGTISITVTPVDDSPVFVTMDLGTIREGEAATIDVVAGDVDGDTFTISAADLPRGATFDGAQLRWTPDFKQAGSYALTFTVVNAQAGEPKVLGLTVLNTNRAPAIDVPGPREVVAGKELNFPVKSSDEDGDEVTLSLDSPPRGMHFDASIGAFRWTPQEEHVGTHYLVFGANDGEAMTRASVTITVSRGATPPVPVPPRAKPASGCSTTHASPQLLFALFALFARARKRHPPR